MIDFSSKTRKKVILCVDPKCQDEKCQKNPLNSQIQSPAQLTLVADNPIENGRGLLIWLNGFAEGFSQFAAIYPIACFIDWVAQLIDPENPEWKAHGFTEEAEFSPNAFYLGLGVTTFLMLGSAYCHSEMQRLTQLKRKNNNIHLSETATQELSLSSIKIFFLISDVFAHWLGKIGMPIIMINLHINTSPLRYTLFILTAFLGAIATIPEFFTCYTTLLDIQALKTKSIIDTTNPAQKTLWSTYNEPLIIFSFFVQCAVSYLDNFLVFQQMTNHLLAGILLAIAPTLSEAVGQYILNTNKKETNQHVCANSNCSVGSQKTTSWTDFMERTMSEKVLLAGRSVSLANGCIEAGLLLTLLCWKDTSPTQDTWLALGFFISGMILCLADPRNIATEIKNYITKKGQESLFGLSMFNDYCCTLSSDKDVTEKLLAQV